MNQATKLFLTILLILAIAASALWIIGGKKSRYSTSLSIDATPDKVFSFVKDMETSRQWISGIDEIETLPPAESAAENANGIGTRHRYTLNLDGERVIFDDEVIRFQENELYSNRSVSPTFVLVSVIQLDPNDDGTTRVTYRVRRANRRFGRLLNVFSQPGIQEKIQDDARRLKDLVEKSPVSGVTRSETVANNE